MNKLMPALMRPLLRMTVMLIGAATLPAMADEPAAGDVHADPMYRVVFGGSDRIASIRAPAEATDHLAAGAAEDWPELAVRWHPREVPVAPDLSR